MKTHRVLLPLLAGVLAGILTSPAHAELRLFAYDDASNYTSWGSDGVNGGDGFTPWTFRADQNPSSYYAGAYFAENKVTLNGIGSQPGNKAWGTYANDGSSVEHPRMAAFRGFGWDGLSSTNALSGRFDEFRISIEHGGIVSFGGASCGFTLRGGNATDNSGDYNNGARFEFGVYGTDSCYSIYDGAGGKLDTGFVTTTNGINLVFRLTNTNTYNLTITDALDPERSTNLTSVLNGSAPIDSVALFNRETNLDDVFFNSIEIWKTVWPTTLVLK